MQLHTQSSPGERSGKFSQNGKFGQNGNVHLGFNVSSSDHNCGCVVDGRNAMVVIGFKISEEVKIIHILSIPYINHQLGVKATRIQCRTFFFTGRKTLRLHIPVSY